LPEIFADTGAAASVNAMKSASRNAARFDGETWQASSQPDRIAGARQMRAPRLLGQDANIGH
jgi:hypothetical protein